MDFLKEFIMVAFYHIIYDTDCEFLIPKYPIKLIDCCLMSKAISQLYQVENKNYDMKIMHAFFFTTYL